MLPTWHSIRGTSQLRSLKIANNIPILNSTRRSYFPSDSPSGYFSSLPTPNPYELPLVSLSRIQLILPVFLPVNIPNFLHHHTIPSLLKTYHRNLSQFQLLLAYFLPVRILKICHHCSDLISHQRSLSSLHILSPVTLPVLIFQACHLQYHVRFHRIILSQLQLIIPVFIPVRIPQVFNRHYLLITHHRNLS